MASPKRPSRVQTDPRLRSRRLEVARKRRNRMLGGLALLVVVAAVVWVAFFSPLLDVTRVRLVGSKHTSAAEVLEATGVRGDNLLLVSTGGLARAVRDLPWVSEAKVDR